MSETTNIEWATSTGNPWTGCRRVSPGCLHCYMFALLKRMGRDATERRRTKGFWTDAVRWNRHAGAQGAADSYDGHAVIHPRIFPSLCDWLDDEVPIEWLADFLKLIHDTPNLDWLLLTKRPEFWKERIALAWDDIRTRLSGNWQLDMWVDAWLRGDAPANIWLGVSVEDQKRADERIPLLLQIPAKVRFLSVEPLLERVSLFEYFHEGEGLAAASRLHWVIVGGESGKDRRDCGEQAIMSVAQQCRAANVPCFVKQDCAFKSGQQGRIPADVWALKQFPKGA